jgi:hypothetical protein
VSPRNRALALRAGKLVLVLTVLIWPWPGLARTYVAAFSSVATVIARPAFADSDVSLSFAPSSESDTSHEWFSMVSVQDAASQARVHRGAIDIRRAGYLQTALFLAVAIGFPLRRWRRCVAVVVAGSALLPMLAWLTIATYLARKQVIHLGVLSSSILALGYRSLICAPGMAFAGPGLLWLVVLRVFDRTPVPGGEGGEGVALPGSADSNAKA